MEVGKIYFAEECCFNCQINTTLPASFPCLWRTQKKLVFYRCCKNKKNTRIELLLKEIQRIPDLRQHQQFFFSLIVCYLLFP